MSAQQGSPSQRAANSWGAADLSSSLGLIHYSSPTQIPSGSNVRIEYAANESNVLSISLCPGSLFPASVCRLLRVSGVLYGVHKALWLPEQVRGFLAFLSEWEVSSIYCAGLLWTVSPFPLGLLSQDSQRTWRSGENWAEGEASFPALAISAPCYSTAIYGNSVPVGSMHGHRAEQVDWFILKNKCLVNI